MSAFSINEIFFSVLCAFIYGVIYCVTFGIIAILRIVIKSFEAFKKSVISYEKIFQVNERIIENKDVEQSSFSIFLNILLFSFGIILTSYVALDGIIRLYMIAIASASIFLFKMSIFRFLRSFLIFIFDIIIEPFYG